MAARPAQRAAYQPQPDSEAAVFGDDRPGRHALDAPAEAEHEEEVECQVEAVEPELEEEGRPGPLDADQPAGHGEDGKRAGKAPDADVEIGHGERADPVARIDDGEGEPAHGRL